MRPPDPAALAGRPLFEPYAALLAELGQAGLPDADGLNRLLQSLAPAACSGSGVPIRFILPAAAAEEGYEAAIHRDGGVPTRPDNWHDFFNALVWCVFPRAKRAINARHVQEIARRPEGLRGPVRDALTQFDECGIVVSSDLPELLQGLREHRWVEVLWDCRAQLRERVRFTVFGHATLDLLREPFVGLCAKALYRQVAAPWLAMPAAQQWQDTDAWLADLLMLLPDLQPRSLKPLPLLGIPGVSADSECADYYRDVRQFRPLRRREAAAGV